MCLEAAMYQDASTLGRQPNHPTRIAEQAAKALDHMVAALQIIDDSDIASVVGARLDHAIEILREEIAKGF